MVYTEKTGAQRLPAATWPAGPFLFMTATRSRARQPNGSARSVFSGDRGATLQQQFPQHRTVAAGFILAVAADREIGVLRQSGEQIKQSPGMRAAHFGAVTAHEMCPLGFAGSVQTDTDGLCARGKVRAPHVVPVLRRELALGHAPRRAAHGTDSRTLALDARAA